MAAVVVKHPNCCLFTMTSLIGYYKQKREKMDTSSPNLAKMDTFEGKNQIKPGRYYIISVESDLAKIDPLKSEIYIISNGCNHLAKKDSMDIQNFSP